MDHQPKELRDNFFFRTPLNKCDTVLRHSEKNVFQIEVKFNIEHVAFSQSWHLLNLKVVVLW